MTDKNSSKTNPVHLTSEDIVTKYRAAGEIAQKALDLALSLCVPDTKILDISTACDKLIISETAPLYKSEKNMVKGIGFPTCIGLNNVVGNLSPLNDNKTVLADGDVVKIDLGVTIDGYVAMAAHTVVVGAATDAATNLINATYTASKVAERLLKVGKSNTEVTEAMCSIAAEYGVSPVVGVLSHNVVRFRCDGEKVITQVDEPDRKAVSVEFEAGEVYILDVVFSSGDGKPTVADTKPTVYKRDPTVKTNALKMKASQQLMQQVDRNAPCFPFSLRAFDARTATLGAVECVRVGALESMPVMSEKKSVSVAQFKVTILLHADGTSQTLASGPAYTVKSAKFVEMLQ